MTACSTSLPSRELIADSVEYMVNAHCADAHGLHFQLRQDHARHADGGAAAQHPGRLRLRRADGGGQGRIGGQDHASLDLIDAMVAGRRRHVSATRTCEAIERSACPTCGSCSGMFTANSMNCLTEALGLALPGNGSVLATHADRKRLFLRGRAPDRRPLPAAITSRTTSACCRAASRPSRPSRTP